MTASKSTSEPSLPPALPQKRTGEATDRLGDRIAELSAHIQAGTYRLLTLIAEFDRREGWGAQGARSCAHWLCWRTGLDLGAAREKVRVARALDELPRISDAMRRGELSYSKARALTRVATPENEEELLDFARAGTAAHVERLVRAWRRVDRLEDAETAERQRRHRYVRTYTDEDGMLVVRARLEPEAGTALVKALDAARDRLYRSERQRPQEPQENAEVDRSPRKPDAPEPEADFGQRQADALALVAESALGRGLDEAEATTGGDHHQVVVHVDAEALLKDSDRGQSVLEGGLHVSAETSRRLACDASKVVMEHDRHGQMLDVGRKTRTVPPAIRRALAFRDRSCRFPGCGVKICDAHHVEHWADGGATKLSNLVLLCRRHHRAVHEEGYRVLLRRDGSTAFFSPAGRKIPRVPAAPRLPGRPVAALRRQNAEGGIRIDETTGLPSWDGGGVDFDWAIQAFRAIGSASDCSPSA